MPPPRTRLQTQRARVPNKRKHPNGHAHVLATPKHKHPADPANLTTKHGGQFRSDVPQPMPPPVPPPPVPGGLVVKLLDPAEPVAGPLGSAPSPPSPPPLRCRLNRKTNMDVLIQNQAEEVITTKKRRLAKKTEHIGETQERCEEDLGPQGLANKDHTGMNDQVGAQSADDALMAATALATSCEAGASEVQRIIAKQVPVLWKLFGTAEGAAILSSAIRLLSCCDGAHRACPFGAVAAAVLGLAVKLSRTDSQPDDVAAIWNEAWPCDFSKANKAHILHAECRIYQSWARKSHEGEYMQVKLGV